MAVGYRKRISIVEALACGGVQIAEFGSCTEALCENLSLDCLGHCSLSVASAMLALGMAFDPEPLAVFLSPEMEHSADLPRSKQFSCRAIECLNSALAFVAMVPEGTAMLMRHVPLGSFPVSIKIVQTMPRQTTAPLNMRVVGTEKPIEA